MRLGLCGLLLLIVGVPMGCNQRKSDVELFDEGRIVVSLSASTRRGYEPLWVDFSAYLETEDRTVREEITEVKWIVTGPNNYRQEIIMDSYNYQEEDRNKEDFFYWDFTFRSPGTYQVRLELNKGEYRSNALSVYVREDPSRRR